MYYLHEVCQPAVIHTTALYSKCAHAQRAWVLLPLPPHAVGHHGISVSMRSLFLENWTQSQLNAGEPFCGTNNGRSSLTTQFSSFLRTCTSVWSVVPSGLAYRTQVLVLAAECGFEFRPWHLCPWARHLIIIASLHPGVKWVPVRAELVD